MARVPQGAPTQATPQSKQWRLGETPWRPAWPRDHGRPRVFIDNDFSGDPDDLFQIVHHLLSPSVDIRGIVASHLRPDDPFDPSGKSAEHAELVLRDLMARMGVDASGVVYRGAASALDDPAVPQPSSASEAIIAEALRGDVEGPLYYLAGGGLTDLASAYLREPSIASRIILVWIGGPEHDGLAGPPPGGMPIEYNLLIDVLAARVLFDVSELEIWQVPRNVYRQCLVSETELRVRVGHSGPIGRHLYEEIEYELTRVREHGLSVRESYALGDSPLVLLTALQSVFEPDSSSSAYVVRPTPHITADGAYRPVAGTRPMRIYTWVDVRLMFEDFYLKLAEFDRWLSE